MSNHRIKTLEKFLAEDPNDPFTIYALAGEWKETNIDKTIEYYEILLKLYPDYLATYYQAAMIFITKGWKDKAENTFRKGLEIAEKQNNTKAKAELSNELNNFLMDDLI